MLMVFANYFGVSREELPLEFPLPRFAPNGSVGIWNLPVYTACPSLEHDPPPSELCNFIQVFTNWPTDSMQSLSKSQWTILQKWKRENLVFIWNCKEQWVLKTILEENQSWCEQSWKTHLSLFQNLLQNYSNQKNMVVTKGKIHKMMDCNSDPRHKPIYLCQSILDKAMKKSGEDNLLKKWGVGEIG